MTREEAIRELKILKEDYWEDDGYGHETEQYGTTISALDMAIKALEQEPVLAKIRAEIFKYEADCRLSVDEYPSCKECTDNVFRTIYNILDKYKAETEEKK